MSKHVKREIDNGLSVLAQSIIDENSLDYINIEEIVFVKYLKDIKSGDVLGRCCLLGDRTQFLSDKKFMIEFPPEYYKLTSDQQRRVMHHELLHIHPKGDRLVDHDIQEFLEIAEKYDGLDLYKKIKLLKQEWNNGKEGKKIKRGKIKVEDGDDNE